MRYARYILLITLILFAFSAIGFAADRYENVVMGDSIAAQFDKDTLRYEKDPYRNEKLVSVWVKTTADYTNDYSLSHYLFRINERQMLLLDTVEYNASGQLLNRVTKQYNPSLWTTILPETVQEACYVSALKYSQLNDAQLQSDYNARTNDPDKNKQSIFSIFTNIFNVCSGNG
jgi:hypothetical protein